MAEHEPTEGLRERYAEAAAEWALLYPLANWGYWGCVTGEARDHLGKIADNLAAAWGRDIADRMAAVRDEEVERLRAELADTREKLAELRDLQVGIKRLTTESGVVEMSLHMAHDMMRACVAGFVKILNAEDAPNYVELAYSLRNDPERYTVTIQRPHGKTPAEVASEAKQQARQAEAALAQLRAYAAWCKSRAVEPEERDLLAIADGREHHDYVVLMKRSGQ